METNMPNNQNALKLLSILLKNQLNKNLKKYVQPEVMKNQYRLLLTSKIAEEYIKHYKQWRKNQ